MDFSRSVAPGNSSRPQSESAVVWAACLVILGAASLTAWEIYTDRHNTLAEGERTLNLAVDALEQHTVETFTQATAAMSSAENMLMAAGGLDRVTPQAAHEWLKAVSPKDSPVDRLVVFDAGGKMIATTARPNPPRPEAFATHPAVAAHTGPEYNDRLYVGLPLELPTDSVIFDPMTTPGSSRWVIPVTRVLHKKDGSRDGVIGTLFRVDYFKEFYGILGNHRDASIALLRQDGMLLARHPFRPEHLGLNIGSVTQYFNESLQQGRLPVMRSPLDNIERIYAARQVKDLPLIVAVGLSTENLLQPWRNRVTQRAAAFCSFAIVVIFLTTLLGRHIRRRRDAEDKLQALNEALEQRVSDRTVQLEQANTDLQAFSYSASHDLRGPIRRIRSFAEVIQSEHGTALPVEAARMFSRIQFSATQMDGLLTDLLTLFQANQAPLQPTMLNLGGMADAIMKDMTADHPERHFELDIQKEGMEAYADEGLIRLALTNLLSNAWKYSSKTDFTRVAVGRAGKAFFIRDNGAGFDMRHAQKLFTAFQRLHSDLEFEGTGIGLAIVKRVIERHGGGIQAEAVPGEGACFYFTLGSRQDIERLSRAS